MAKKVKIDRTDDPAADAESLDEGAAEPAADGARPGSEETGAPATGSGGPTIEELVPGLGGAPSGDDEAEAPAEDPQAARIAELEAETATLKDRLLRALAELENTRRRAERDRKDAETYGGTRLARDLLAVYDNLTRALAAADDELREQHGAFIEGVELTQRELLNAFGKHRIELVSPERGVKFDPNRHQAMFEAPVPGAKAGTVIEVMQPGFMIADRLLRPAMVGVARGGEAAPAASAGSDSASGGSNAGESGSES